MILNPYVDDEDEFIILPHGGDLAGGAVASRYGIDAYPFTKDALVKRKVNHLRSVTLDCLLGKDFTDMWDLDNKNVLVYLDDYLFETASVYKQLKEGYCKTKREYPECEVVLVPLKPGFSNADAETDWPILPAQKCATVIKHIFTHQLVGSALVAFGKDGKLLSRSAWESIRESDEALFKDSLYNEILEDVTEKLGPYTYKVNRL